MTSCENTCICFVLWVLVVRVGVVKSMVGRLLLLAFCVYCVVSEFCAKNKQGTKKCRLGQELFRAQCVVFRSPSVAVSSRIFYLRKT